MRHFASSRFARAVKRIPKSPVPSDTYMAILEGSSTLCRGKLAGIPASRAKVALYFTDHIVTDKFASFAPSSFIS